MLEHKQCWVHVHTEGVVHCSAFSPRMQREAVRLGRLWFDCCSISVGATEPCTSSCARCEQKRPNSDRATLKQVPLSLRFTSFGTACASSWNTQPGTLWSSAGHQLLPYKTTWAMRGPNRWAGNINADTWQRGWDLWFLLVLYPFWEGNASGPSSVIADRPHRGQEICRTSRESGQQLVEEIEALLHNSSWVSYSHHQLICTVTKPFKAIE